MTRTRLTKPQSKQPSPAIASNLFPQPSSFAPEQATTTLSKTEFQGLSQELSFPVQAKLTIGEPNDKYEQEADRVADQVLKQIHALDISKSEDDQIQRQETGRSSNISPFKFPSLQKKEGNSFSTPTSHLETSIQQTRGTGQKLPNSLRPKMEQAFGSDLSHIKIHSDSHADRLSRTIQAKAFTTGQDIFFRKGEYKPQTTDGQKLIAHELTHTFQQNQTNQQQMPVQRKIDEEDYRLKKLDSDEVSKYKRFIPLHTIAYANKQEKLLYQSDEKVFPGMYKSSVKDTVINGLGFDPSKYPHLTNNLIENYEEEVLTKNPSGDKHLSREVMEGGYSPHKEYKFQPSESDSIFSFHISHGNRVVTLTPRVPTAVPPDFLKVQSLLRKTGSGTTFGEHDPMHSGTHYTNTPLGGTHMHFVSKKAIKLSVIDKVITALEATELIGKRKKSLKDKRVVRQIETVGKDYVPASESAKNVAFKVRKAFDTPMYREEQAFRDLVKKKSEEQQQDPYGGLISSVPTPDVEFE